MPKIKSRAMRTSNCDEDFQSLEPHQLPTTDALRMCKKTTDIDEIIDLTKHSNPSVRQAALREMCPCRVKQDITDFWHRVLEMTGDESDTVRYQVLHTLCDGSPAHLEFEVAEALEVFNKDSSSHVRRQASRALGAYRRTGKWNIL